VAANGLLVGTPPYVASPAAGYGQALSLNGSSQYVSLPEPGPLDTTTAGNFTWNALITTTDAVNTRIAIGLSDAIPNYLVLGLTGGKAYIQWHGIGQIIGTTNIADGLPHRLRLAVSGGGSPAAYLFVDGVLQNAGGTPFTGYTPPAASATAYIGGWVSTANYWSGTLDDVSIWSTCLSTASYTPATTPTASGATNLVALYALDGNVLDTAHPSITATPGTIGVLSGTQTVAIAGVTTAFSTASSAQFTIAAATGSPSTPPSIAWQAASSGTAATLGINPGAGYGALPATLTITDTTDGGATTTLTVLPVAVSLTPTSAALFTGVTQQVTATVTGASDTGATYAITEGASGGTITASGLYTAPATAGTYHIVATSHADPTRTATAVVTVVAPTAPTAPAGVTLTPTASGNVVTLPVASTPGSYPVGRYALRQGTTPGGETATVVATITPSSFPASFPAQPPAAAGQVVYYTVQAGDSQATPLFSAASNEVGQRTSTLTASGVTYPALTQALYGPSATGLAATLGYTIYDTAVPVAGVLVAHTTSNTSEIPGTGVYSAPLTLDVAWGSVQVVWDAPAGSTSYPDVLAPPQGPASGVSAAAIGVAVLAALNTAQVATYLPTPNSAMDHIWAAGRLLLGQRTIANAPSGGGVWATYLLQDGATTFAVVKLPRPLGVALQAGDSITASRS